jgi:hypothetical protein
MKKYILLGLGVFILTGCASKKEVNIRDIVDNTKKETDTVVLTPYQMKITPIVSSHQNDAKVIVDEGVVLKIWIAPYKVKNTLIAGHDVYTWAKKPHFIVGEDMPKYNSKQTSLFTANGQVPFLLKTEELDTSKELPNKKIKKYVNTLYKVRAGKAIYLKKKAEENHYDKAIQAYLEKKKKERKKINEKSRK